MKFNTSKYFAIDWGEFEPRNLVIYLGIIISLYFTVSESPSMLPIALYMAIGGAAILTKQAFNSRAKRRELAERNKGPPF